MAGKRWAGPSGHRVFDSRWRAQQYSRTLSVMKQWILSLAAKPLLIGAVLVGQQTLAQSGAAHHFRWSERLAHELSYQHTVATARELTATGRASLLAYILDRFKHPVSEHAAAMLEGIPDDEMRELAALTRLEMIDLNGDGKGEFVAQGNGLGPCGGTGNCIVLVMRDTPKGIELLLDSWGRRLRRRLREDPCARNGNQRISRYRPRITRLGI